MKMHRNKLQLRKRNICKSLHNKVRVKECARHQRKITTIISDHDDHWQFARYKKMQMVIIGLSNFHRYQFFSAHITTVYCHVIIHCDNSYQNQNEWESSRQIHNDVNVWMYGTYQEILLRIYGRYIVEM